MCVYGEGEWEKLLLLFIGYISFPTPGFHCATADAAAATLISIRNNCGTAGFIFIPRGGGGGERANDIIGKGSTLMLHLPLSRVPLTPCRCLVVTFDIYATIENEQNTLSVINLAQWENEKNWRPRESHGLLKAWECLVVLGWCSSSSWSMLHTFLKPLGKYEATFPFPPDAISIIWGLNGDRNDWRLLLMIWRETKKPLLNFNPPATFRYQ